jgi:hypothetical protein
VVWVVEGVRYRPLFRAVVDKGRCWD